MSTKTITTKERIERGEILPPKNDVVFSALFTRGKESITKALLEDILKIKIHSLDLDKSKELLNDNQKDKNGRLDLRAIINENIECDIEVQLSTHEKMLERFLYYWAKIYATNLDIGDEYKDLRKTICIIIVDDEIKEFKEIVKAHTKWQIREEEYLDKVLTPYFELDIIEMPKAIEQYKLNRKDEVLQWMMFLEDPEDMEVSKIMESNENIKKAKKELDEISKDEVLRRMALRAKLERMDIKQSIEDATNRGKLEGKLEDAKKMLEKGIDIDIIMDVTGLLKDEILKMQNNS